MSILFRNATTGQTLTTVSERTMPLDSAEFARLYERKYSHTIRVLSAKGLREDMAHEFAQAGWARAWERRGQLRQTARVVEWVISIAINLFRTSLRHERREEQPKAVQQSDSALIGGLLLDELLKSSKTYRPILESFYLWGFSANEIAEAYHTSPLAVRVRLSRGRAQLRRAAHGGKSDTEAVTVSCT